MSINQATFILDQHSAGKLERNDVSLATVLWAVHTLHNAVNK
jgi:hypothetical protein